jgi:hypothetical protein
MIDYESDIKIISGCNNVNSAIFIIFLCVFSIIATAIELGRSPGNFINSHGHQI